MKNVDFESAFAFYLLKLPFLNMFCNLQMRSGYYTELHLSIYFCAFTQVIRNILQRHPHHCLACPFTNQNPFFNHASHQVG